MSYRVGVGQYQPSIPCAGNNVLQLGGGMQGLGCDCQERKGLGLFDGGFDPSTWGIGEYAVLAVGAYLVLSIAGDTRRGVSAVKQSVRRGKRRRAIKARLSE